MYSFNFCYRMIGNCILQLALYFSRHVRTHTGERVVKCDQCDATFIDKITLTRHIAKAHSSGQAQHICHICGAAHYLLLDLKKHLDRHEGKFRVTCDTCGETFAEARTLQSHRVKVHGDDPLICDEWYFLHTFVN